MATDQETILKTFQEYAKAFETLNPLSVLDFYHFPAMLISPSKTVSIGNWAVGLGVFLLVMLELKARGYERSEMQALNVNQLSDEIAIISGSVTRYKEQNIILEKFGLSYTLQKVDNTWKITIGILYKLPTL
jgi:hypothetical protein